MNRLYYGDCLTIMQEWPLASVDLIYLDPPFNSNRQYNGGLLRGQTPSHAGSGLVVRFIWDSQVRHTAGERAWPGELVAGLLLFSRVR